MSKNEKIGAAATVAIILAYGCLMSYFVGRSDGRSEVRAERAEEREQQRAARDLDDRFAQLEQRIRHEIKMSRTQP